MKKLQIIIASIASLIIGLGCSMPEPEEKLIFLDNKDQNSVYYHDYNEDIPKKIEIKIEAETTFRDTIIDGEWSFYIDENSNLMWIPRDNVEPIIVSGEHQKVTNFDVKQEHSIIAYSSTCAKFTNSAIFVRSLPEGNIKAIFDTKCDDLKPKISSDGFWVAFQSGEGEKSKIFTGHIPSQTMKSIGEGNSPRWR